MRNFNEDLSLWQLMVSIENFTETKRIYFFKARICVSRIQVSNFCKVFP
jgi:hypothetical protein